MTTVKPDILSTKDKAEREFPSVSLEQQEKPAKRLH